MTAGGLISALQQLDEMVLGLAADRDAAVARAIELERAVEGLRRRVAELVGERGRERAASEPLGGEPTLFEGDS